MSVSCHVEISCVYCALSIAFNRKHGGTEDMASIKSSDFDLSCSIESLECHCFMQLNSLYLVDAPFDHLLTKSIYSTFLSNRNFSKIFQHQRNNSFCRWCRDYRPIVPNGLRKIGKGSTVIQMEVRHDHQVNDVCKVDLESLRSGVNLLAFLLE